MIESSEENSGIKESTNSKIDLDSSSSDEGVDDPMPTQRPPSDNEDDESM